MTERMKRQVRTPFNEWIDRLPTYANSSSVSLSPIHELPEQRYDYSAYNLVPYKTSSRTGSDVEPIKYSRHTALKDTRSINRLVITPLPHRSQKPVAAKSGVKDRVNTDDILNAVRTRIRSAKLNLADEATDTKMHHSNVKDVDRILQHYLQSVADNPLTLEPSKTSIIPLKAAQVYERTMLAPDHELGLLGSCPCCQTINEDNLRKRAHPSLDVLSYPNNADSILLNTRDSTSNQGHWLLKDNETYTTPRQRQLDLPDYGGLLLHNTDPFVAFYPQSRGNSTPLEFEKSSNIAQSHDRYQQALDRLGNYVNGKRDEPDPYLQSLMALPSSELRSEHSIARHQLYGHWSPPTTPLHPVNFNRPEPFRQPLVIPTRRRRPLASPTPFASLQPESVAPRNKLVTFNRQPPVQIEYTPENSSLNDADVRKRQSNKYMTHKSSISPRDQLPPMS